MTVDSPATGRRTDDALDTVVDLSIHLRSAGNTVLDVIRSVGENLQELEVLTLLHRAGTPYLLYANVLLRDLGITSGALTGRLDNLERSGDLLRRPDTRDRRRTRVVLTPEGLRRVTRARLLLAGAEGDRRA